MGALEEHVQNPAFDRIQAVWSFMGQDMLFGFVYSACTEESAMLLRDAILSSYPTNASQFESSLHSALLTHLSLYFWHLDYPSGSLFDCHKAVDLARPALKALSNLDAFIDSETTLEDLTKTLEDEDEDNLFLKKRVKQKQRKRTLRSQKAPAIVDHRPFDNLGIPVPTFRSDALARAEELLKDQKGILLHYLDVLRKPELAAIFKDAYLPQVGDEENIEPRSAQAGGGATDTSSVPEQNMEVPAAYPMVQPMKAAFHFDSVDGFGEWQILVSTRADRNLREYKRSDQKIFAIILKKIKELSNGHFSDDNQKKLTGKDVGVPIFEAKMTRDTRLVYQVDCVREFESEVDRQVLRIFGIYTHAQLERPFWDAVGQHLAGKGKEYRKRCIYRKPPKNAGDKVYSPECFPPSQESDVPQTPVHLPDLRDNDREELHSLLVLQKFVTFSQALLNSILADQDVQHVFHMSTPEQAIVKHNGSCYVLGRSGTGKTTTMLFKMLGIERAWVAHRDELDAGVAKPRQVFVTQSRVLAEKVEEYYLKLTESHVAATRSAQEAAELGAQKQNPEDRALVDQDEEELHRGVLPKRFSELRDEHFPLFVTFDHLCRLLEGDFRASDKGDLTLSPTDEKEVEDPSTVASDYMLQRRDSFVSYGTFLQAYWPHLPQPLTKNFDPALIFAEIMGVIKGSESALKTEQGYLDEQAYIAVSHRQQGTFAGRREAVYALFSAYLRVKRERRDWDAADRTHAILRGLEEVGVPGKKIDFLYVDEAQDNLLVDALVLRNLCSNPDGLFWAGDTAQTISVGSSFRFDDLKAFLYRRELVSAPKGLTLKSPESFQLTVNYRSHGGIVRCAHSVVQLITKFWPHAIDTLAEEKGVVDGLKPIFFSGWDQDTVQYEQFLFGATGSQIEFGAQQCILVRDDAARSRLQAQMGDIGLILTLYESKGLEFNDVLLYNFFEDSTVELSQWRVVLNALDDSLKKRLKCPQFDDARHSGVCRELKFLYVAITRARKNLWIADCSEKGEPLRTFWNAQQLVKNCSAADEVPRLAMSSTPEEWAATARTLFDNRRYLQAVRCYDRAGMPRQKDVAYAYHLRERARGTEKTRRTTDNARILAFVDAAEAFAKSASVASAARERVAYYRIAAECFVEADDHRRAAEAYLRAEDFTKAAQHYRKAGLFDEAVNVVQNHRQSIPEKFADTIIDVAKLHYIKENRLDRATTLFPTVDDALEFMDDYGFDVARATLLEQSGRFAEAAELHLEEGRPLQAIHLFVRDWDDHHSRRRAEECVLHGLWGYLSFGVTAKDGYEKSDLGRLLQAAKDIKDKAGANMSRHTSDQLAMFDCIARGQTAELQVLGERLLSAHSDNAAALLCLDHVFNKPVKVQAATAPEAASTLMAFLIYCREVQRIGSEPSPGQDSDLRKLFGFRGADGADNVYILSSGTFLHTYHYRRLGNTAPPDETQDITLNDWDLIDLLRLVLRERLKRRVNDENFLCSKARAIFPCPTLALFGRCHSNDCFRGHQENATMDVDGYNSRVRLIFQQVLIYQTIAGLEHRNAIAGQQRFWLSSLYHTMYPSHPKLGVATSLKLGSIPEAEKAIQVIKDWIRDLLYNLSPWLCERRLFLTDVAELMALAFAFDRTAARDYIPRAPFFADRRRWPRDLMRGKDNDRYIVHDLFVALSASDASSVAAGALFLQAVVEGRLSINLSVFCQLFDFISASFILHHRLHKNGGPHDTTLSRRWITTLWGNGAPDPKDASVLPLLIRPLKELLSEACHGSPGSASSNFFFYERDKTKIETQIRNIFVARICYNVCLLGYNIPDWQLRNEIHRAIISIRQPARSYSSLIFRYVKASGWDDLVRAMRNTAETEASDFDHLAQLKDASKLNGPVHPIRGIRAVVYGNPADIVPLVNGAKIEAAPQAKSNLRADAAPFVPARFLKADVAAEEDEDEGEDDDHVEDSSAQEEDAGIDHTIDLDAAARTVDAAHIEQVAAPPSEEEIAAAKCFASTYRRLLSRRQGVPKKGLPAARARWFLTCQELSQKLSRSYRVLYLGPLPHALVCVEKINAYAINNKKTAHLRTQLAGQDAYEKVMAEVDDAIRLTRKVKPLKTLLEPISKLHAEEKFEELRQGIVRLQELSACVPVTVAQEWAWDLQMAIKGIVQPRAPPKRKAKPELVIEDDDMYY
ncbi:hypothetical protein PsYK624_103810 [Phanerochaete sordida]|uniref:UvrD-like helicase ATP-binding domain-containing protein n=1 Tax=Phanerochaete sordida TaxID=48140 RepID=A0A9P3LGU7_9APHY|nr:hypothetical protein PsYK624_103810 [Phanerochaete sordida]